jgi:hypothetical protein
MPSVPVPSSLLHYEQVPPGVQMLLEQSRTYLTNHQWTLAERCALDAQDACRHSGVHVGLAVAQLHLADIYREVGELGKALGLCEEAYRILHSRPAKAQRHNEAVAAYAQGLLHELLLFGDDLRAVNWYQEALELFKKAQEHWAARNDRSRYGTCRHAHRCVEERKKRIVSIHAGGQTKLNTLDILQPDSADTPFARQGNLQGRITDDHHVEINKAAYHLHCGTLPSSETDGTHYCFALPVPVDRWAFPKARVGDYVLIRLHWWLDEGKLGVVWIHGNGWVAGNFMRGPDDRLWFHPCPTSARVIGGAVARDPAENVKGYIIGLLKPT